MNLRLERYGAPPAFVRGLGDLRRSGVTPRGLLFLALDPAGAIHLAVPSDADEVTRIKVGDKMALAWPLEGRFYHFDSVHRLRDGFYVFNGDRRLKDPGDHVEVAGIVTEFLKVAGAKNVFFGCRPHQPGSWIVGGKQAVALHEQGFVEVVPVAQGLLARRIVDHRLWLHTFEALAQRGRLDLWQAVYDSPLGNVLMLERRVMGDRLVLTCEQGLVEVDVAKLPTVGEVAKVPMSIGMGVVGRVEGGAFAVTQGKPQPWGLDELRPAVLIGATGGSLHALGQALAEAAKAARKTPAPTG